MRQIRRARGKSLRVVAGLAGMSRSHLDRIERGETAVAEHLGFLAAAGARVALAKGAFDIAQAVLNAVTVPTDTPAMTQLAGHLALHWSVVAAADRRSDDVGAPLE